MKENENKPGCLTKVTNTHGRRTMKYVELVMSREKSGFRRGTTLGGVAGIWVELWGLEKSNRRR